MKQFLKFAGLGALVLNLIAFILVIACDGVGISFGGATIYAKGTTILFGNDSTKLSVLPLIGWIILILTMICLGVLAVFDLMKKDTFKKNEKVIYIVLTVLLFLAGLFVFLTIPSFAAANDIPSDSLKYYVVGGGWIAGGIMAVLAAGLCGVKAFVKAK